MSFAIEVTAIMLHDLQFSSHLLILAPFSHHLDAIFHCGLFRLVVARYPENTLVISALACEPGFEGGVVRGAAYSTDVPGKEEIWGGCELEGFIGLCHAPGGGPRLLGKVSFGS
jgi:hypothetical protein